jgi:hypothetical protein
MRKRMTLFYRILAKSKFIRIDQIGKRVLDGIECDIPNFLRGHISEQLLLIVPLPFGFPLQQTTIRAGRRRGGRREDGRERREGD